MNLTFYSARLSSATPVTAALAELEVPHQEVRLDLTNKDQKQADFLKLNPHGKVPVLVVDGTPMFEALAIMQWLGDRFGTERGLWPRFDDPQRLQALSWTTWSYVEYVAALVRLTQASSERSPAELRSEAQTRHVKEQLNTHLRILDAHLAQGGYILGEAYSLADLIVANVIAYGAMCGASVEGYQHVAKWLEECQQRPSFKSAWQ